MQSPHLLRLRLVKRIVLVAAVAALGPPLTLGTLWASPPVGDCPPSGFELESLDAIGLDDYKGQPPYDMDNDGYTCRKPISSYPHYVYVDNMVPPSSPH
jgi:hypothetical protein